MQSFNNTVSVECRDDKYVDYFPGKGEIGGGLNIFTSTEVKSSMPETIYLESPTTALEMLESRGVTFNIYRSLDFASLKKSPLEGKTGSEKFIGSSAIKVGGLLKDDLSPKDLSDVSVADLVSIDDINMAVSSITPKLSSVNSFQPPNDNIAKVTSRISAPSRVIAPQTMVLVASKDSAIKNSESMLKSLEWKPIEEIVHTKGTVVLCRQDNGSDEVANAYFLMETK